MGGHTFWIEEKLDGERIQLHKKGEDFKFFSRYFHRYQHTEMSRKAKDYTGLYGKSLNDEDSSLTRHLKNAFVPGCRELAPGERAKLIIAASFWTAK